ncbi:MAG: ferritin family protein [Candidatus Latescibacteria bacterium]|jgi:rubrerythrin|nr:ferritin family protein [Candidatus Latescibacterota bacterium]
MSNHNSIDEILDFAIEKEEEAFQFYTQLASSMKRPSMQGIFHDFASEEKLHKEKLEALKKENLSIPESEKVIDLKISDYLVDAETGPEMDYQQALIVAMKKEKSAYKLYIDLADKTQDENVGKMFLFLAHEEAKHKLRIEIEYDDYILKEN